MSPTTLPAGPEHGHVTFLGAGPGDPGLLTLRAVEALANADVLVAEPEVIDVVRTHDPPAATRGLHDKMCRIPHRGGTGGC